MLFYPGSNKKKKQQKTKKRAYEQRKKCERQKKLKLDVKCSNQYAQKLVTPEIEGISAVINMDSHGKYFRFSLSLYNHFQTLSSKVMN